MNKIIALDHQYLLEPELKTILSSTNSRDIRMLAYHANHVAGPAHHSEIGMQPRTGINNLPFKNILAEYIEADMPEYNADFDLSWSDVTDQRARELEKLLIDNHKQAVVLWSGGIDSTCMVVAILKNFDKSNLSRVQIACNRNGIVEYPKFYFEYICKYFQLVDTVEFYNAFPDTNNIIAVHGNEGDRIMIGMVPYYDYCMSVRNNDLLDRSWKKDADTLIKHVAEKSRSKDYAVWYYEKACQSIESVQVPLTTYLDLMWWMGFNYNWTHQVIGPWLALNRTDRISWPQYQAQRIAWYNTKHYQQWSMKNNGPMVKHQGKFGTLKHHAKDYIFDYNRDTWYRDNKIKVVSTCMAPNSLEGRPFAITDQFEILYLDRDLELILQLLPDYLQ
jgi:hypothetical protein